MKNLKRMMLVLFFMLASVLCLSGCDFSKIIDDIGQDDEEETVNLEIDEEESKSKLKELESDGYFISIKTTEGNGDDKNESFYSIGVKGNVMWTSTSNEDYTALMTDGNSLHVYEKEGDEWVYSYSLNDLEDPEELKESFKAMINVLLYMGNIYDGQLKKGKTATIAGRNCQIYTFGIDTLGGMVGSLIGGFSYKYTFYIDKETGLTLKYEIEGQYQNEEAKVTFEVTKFDTGSKVVCPTLPEPVLNDDPLTE